MENISPDTANGILGSSVDTLPILASASTINEDAKERLCTGKTFSPGTNRMAPLQGKKIFMHYEPGTNVNKRVEVVLKRLKAELVDFFSRDINYVITNRSFNRSSRSPVHVLTSSNSSPSQISPGGDPPKLQPAINVSLGVRNSGLKTPKLMGNKPQTPAVTRGRAMLMAARKSTPTTGNVSLDDSPSDALPSSILRQIQPNNTSLTPTEPGASSYSPAPRLSMNNTALNRPTEVKSYPNDLLVRARQLGIKILTVDMVVKWIMNLPSDVQSYIETAQRTDSDELCADIAEDPERDRICQVRQLKVPCIKVVDLRGLSRPLYLDHTDYLPGLWSLHARPRLKSLIASDSTEVTTGNNTPVCSGSIPAASLGCGPPPPHHTTSQLQPQGGAGTTTPSVLSRQNSRHKRKERLVKHSGKSGHPLQRSASVSGKLFDTGRSKAVAEDEPSGYCECCTVNFKNLFEHLTCEEHQQFAHNGENYRLLDDVLNKLPSIQSFLARERDALTRHSEKSSSDRRQGKTHRSRQSSGSKTTTTTVTKSTNQSSTLSQSLEVPVKEGLPSFRESPAPLLTEQPTAICPPPLSLHEVVSVEGNVSGAGHKQLFSDEDVNDICGPLVVDPTIEDALRTVTNATAADILNTVTCEDHIQPIQHTISIAAKESVDLDGSPKSADVAKIVPESWPLCFSETAVAVQYPGNYPTEPANPHLLEAWHAVCSDVFMNERIDQHDSRVTKINSSSPIESPILESFHRACQDCLRSHIPCNVPRQLHLQLHSLVGPTNTLDGIGCTGYGSSFVFSEHASSTESLCSVHEEEPELGTAPLVELVNAQASPSPKSIANGPYTTPPFSPVFDCADDSTDNEATDSTVPFLVPETPSSPPSINKLPHVRQHTPSSHSYTMTPPVLKLSVSHKPGLPSSMTDGLFVDKPPQNISTPIASPSYHHHWLPYDAYSDQPVTNVTLSPASSTRSDFVCYRRSDVWKLNSTSFECTLPADSRGAVCASTTDKHSRVHSKADKLTKRSRRRRQQARSMSEGKTLSNLPVVKRPKVTSKSSFSLNKYPQKTVSKTAADQTSTKRNARSARKKRARHEPVATVMTPDRLMAPRLAAKVAREAISLSVRALFSPSGMDRCFEPRHHVICAARLSSTDALPITPPRRRTQQHIVQTPSRTCFIGLADAPQGGGTFRSRSHNRTLFPERIAS